MHMCAWQRALLQSCSRKAQCLGCTCAVAKTIVNMEQSYVTAAFFRHRTAERYKAMMQAQQTAKLLGEGGRASPFVPRTLGQVCDI